MTAQRRHGESGVTLIELLIAVTLLSLLSVGMLFAMRIGLNAMGKTNNHVTNLRRTLGVDRIITQQLAGFFPAMAVCQAGGGPPTTAVSFFQGDPQTMRFLSTYSLQEAGRGLPRILEFQVIPGENGHGVRLVVNEYLYTGPPSIAGFCAGVLPDPETGGRIVQWRPVTTAPNSFVLADRLAYCRFAYKRETEEDKPDIWYPRWPFETNPKAVSIQWAPLDPDPSRIQLPPIIAPLRVDRDPQREYHEW